MDFRPPPDPDAAEWSGTIVGVSNAVTRTRGPVASGPIDAQKCAQIVELARRRLEGKQAYIADAIVHDSRVRLFTDSHHLADFWTHHWYGAQEWRERGGLVPPERPRLTVYAVSGLPNLEPQTLVCAERDTIVVANTAWYGTLRSEVQAQLGRILVESGAHLVRASAVVLGGRTTLCLGPGRTTAALGLMEQGGARFHSDDAVVVRFGWRRRASGWLLPHRLAEPPPERVAGVTEDGHAIECAASELDTGELRAFAYPTERRAYVRTDVLRSHPRHAWAVLRSRVENAPEHGSAPEDLVSGASAVADPAARSFLANAGDALGRLVAFDGTRALVDPAQAFGPSRVVLNPWEPVPVGALRGEVGEEPAMKLLRRGVEGALAGAKR
jgi:hypothetical protein